MESGIKCAPSVLGSRKKKRNVWPSDGTEKLSRSVLGVFVLAHPSDSRFEIHVLLGTRTKQIIVMIAILSIL